MTRQRRLRDVAAKWTGTRALEDCIVCGNDFAEYEAFVNGGVFSLCRACWAPSYPDFGPGGDRRIGSGTQRPAPQRDSAPTTNRGTADSLSLEVTTDSLDRRDSWPIVASTPAL